MYEFMWTDSGNYLLCLQIWVILVQSLKLTSADPLIKNRECLLQNLILLK